ncbi:LysR family transcriptional regulator [Rhizobium ruizarguesonis]|jgi:DNA-binding transcriptional LysR family regulator|uniref:LysR family transcriptional regulator n=1 Tax=Rhizobium ruizarguesonis TaxID=2081791 RepID=UPI00103EF7A1|nr:LysR family transcriptional regulator [Rhizobium ruizarguesonis]MBY5834181.1 LysR family transcriptional regulator [Rhizobium leguminosarum]TBY60442.1 LysR family transcriptional regulator [Rhizobium leguminosarum bv. viciae]MBY5847793.1 LysR family transcriptional regulator [Rhizobium leguminosarum]MBY5856030.1 LysR family transcriptional regulator [Rhizobium leguminosarum]MBY5862423.1 LysR family transcriptional regulator [Rhizobium leguminosarum]
MQFKRNEIHELSIFLAIVQYRSFRKAADHLEVTASALSHSMKALEQRLGVRLLNRTSRSVAPTAAGTALAEKISAGLELINSGLEDLNGHYQGGAGSIRINVLKDAAVLLLRPAIPVFQQRFPNVELEVAVDDQFVDVTADGFDAGIRYSGTIPEDMIAVPLTPPLKWIAVAAPDYLRNHGRPVMPEDLNSHRCIRIRTGRGQIYKWEFERGDDRREIDVPGALISGETDLAINAALEGAGLCYCLERLASPYVAAGRLEVVLPKWASMGPPFSMYYSSRRQLPFGVDVLIKLIRGLNGL